MQKKQLFIPFIALTFLLASITFDLKPTFAASPSPSPKVSPTPSASPSSIDSDSVTENLKKRLQESLDLDSSTTATTKARAYVGIVKDVIKDTIIMEDKDGKKDVKIQDGTTILRAPANTAIKTENIRIDDYIIAIGYPGESDMLLGKRLIVSADPIKPPAKVSGLGTIAKIAKNSLTLKLADKDQVLSLTTKTIIKSAGGTIELTDLAVGDTLIYTAKTDDSDLTATILMRVETTTITQ